MTNSSEVLSPDLVERVLERLSLPGRPPISPDGLRALYAAWCQRVPFDNVRKLIHLRSGAGGPFPGSEASDFFEAWLRYGAGATCWGGHGALHALLTAVGFSARRGYATMLIAENIPPNHATVVVDLEGRRYLVDASMMHGVPLELSATATTRVNHPAWGVEAGPHDELHLIHWRPIHMPQGLACRIDRLGVSAETFREFHEGSRPWSPFNYELYARINKGDSVVGGGFGQRFRFGFDGTVQQQPLLPKDRLRFLVEDVGIAEELAVQVPADIPTPPPPGTAKAASGG